MNTCRECKYWKLITGNPDYVKETGDYRFSKPNVDNFIASNPNPQTQEEWNQFSTELHTAIDKEYPDPWGTCSREDYPNSPMFTNDASLCFSALRTRDSHGCTAWENK
jgi:hypothetical protein